MSEQAINHIRGIRGRTRVQNLGRISSGGTPSPLTTKGDLYGFNTSAARIPVGSIGQALVAQPGASLGVAWQTFPGSVDTTPNPANAQDDEFSDLTGQSGPVNGLNAKWTQFNNANLTNTFAGGYWTPSFAITVNSQNSLGGFTQPLPAVGTDFEYVTKIQQFSPYTNAAGFFAALGIVLKENATGKIGAIMVGIWNTNSCATINFSAAQNGAVSNQVIHTRVFGIFITYLKVKRVGTTITWSISGPGDGVNFTPLLIETNTTYFTTAPDQVGICCYGFQTAFTPILGACDFFRRNI